MVIQYLETHFLVIIITHIIVFYLNVSSLLEV